jgi:hypothetical protein
MAPPRAIPLNMNRRAFLTLSAGAVAFVLAGRRLTIAFSADGPRCSCSGHPCHCRWRLQAGALIAVR